MNHLLLEIMEGEAGPGGSLPVRPRERDDEDIAPERRAFSLGSGMKLKGDLELYSK